MLTVAELREIRARAEATTSRVGHSVADVEFDRYARADVVRLLDEVERLRGALEAVDRAECCGCSIYGTIARAALAGQAIALDTSDPCKTRLKEPAIPT